MEVDADATGDALIAAREEVDVDMGSQPKACTWVRGTLQCMLHQNTTVHTAPPPPSGGIRSDAQPSLGDNPQQMPSLEGMASSREE